MITEDYVSFETAKLLKEKGFRENCIATYNLVTKNFEIEEVYQDWTTRWKDYISAPTLQLAMKWLREIHKIGVFPTTFYRELNNNVKHDYGSTIVRLDTFEVIGNKNLEDYTFASDTYEGTVEKVIKYCLENLI